jgi:hypothetical protein
MGTAKGQGGGQGEIPLGPGNENAHHDADYRQNSNTYPDLRCFAHSFLLSQSVASLFYATVSFATKVNGLTKQLTSRTAFSAA